MEEPPKRKSHRLQGYDYSKNGYYVVTICTDKKKTNFIECRAGACSRRKLPPCTVPTATPPYASHIGRGAEVLGGEGRPCKHTSLPFVYYSAFSRKRRNQKAAIGAFPLLPLCGSSRCICPPSDVHPSARQPLRHLHEMWICGRRLFSTRTGATGHRWM